MHKVFLPSLMDLDRKTVGIVEEGHLLPCEGIGPDRLAGDSLFLKLGDNPVHALDPKGQMAQAVRLRTRTRWMVLHDKQFQLAASHLEINLPVVTLGPVVLANNRKAEQLMIKPQRSSFIRTDDGDMMNGIQVHNSTPMQDSGFWHMPEG